MNVSMIDLQAQYNQVRADVDKAVARVMASQSFILGSEVERFETLLAGYCGAKYAIGVSSGTDAILVAITALGRTHGLNEIITSPFTFIGTASAIVRCGYKPVFADIDPLTFNIDPDSVNEKINKNTLSVLPVHLFGQMADMDRIHWVVNSLDRVGIAIIEDAAQAIGAVHHKRLAGNCFSDAGCFSFFPTKTLGAYGDGGMIITNLTTINSISKIVRVQGQTKKYDSSLVSGNFRLDEIQAAILLEKSYYLNSWIDARRANAKNYNAMFWDSGFSIPLDALTDGCMGVVCPFEALDSLHTYHQYVIRVPESRRGALMAHLAGAGIETAIHYPIPLHLQDAFAYLGHKPGDFPQAELAASQVLSLPVHPALTYEMQEYVVSKIVEFFGVNHGKA